MSVFGYLVNRVRFAALLAAASSLALAGCDRSHKSKDTTSAAGPLQLDPVPERMLPVISGAELHKLVRASRKPVLVEFGVNFNCVRCDEMQPQLGRLAREFDGRAQVVRVDYNAHRGLVAQYGGNICPSYVLFDDGKHVVTRSYPTSVDLLAADLNAAAAPHAPQVAPTENGGS